jgi:hypothetical protein
MIKKKCKDDLNLERRFDLCTITQPIADNTHLFLRHEYKHRNLIAQLKTFEVQQEVRCIS